MDTRIQDFKHMAQEFLAGKERKNSYEFKSLDEETLEEGYCLNVLTDEEVTGIRELKEKYDKEYVKHLEEVFGDPDIVYDLAPGSEILEIDLDHIYHEYTFGIHELHPEGKVMNRSEKVELSDDEYAELIAWHLYDENMTINLLRLRDRNLYDKILNGIDVYYYFSRIFYEADYPFLVSLDEAKADAEMIRKQSKLRRTGGYRTI